MPFEKERDTAVGAVRAAADLCQRVQRGMVKADTLLKKDRSPVTIADYGSQALVARVLARTFPGDPMVGEESSEALRAGGQEELRSRVMAEVRRAAPEATEEEVLGWIDRGSSPGGRQRFWTLDPIDGTKGFLRGEQYAIALALVVDGAVEVAVLGCPNLPFEAAEGQGSLFVAVRGQGARVQTLDGSREHAIAASRCGDFREARILESVEAAHGDHSSHERIKELLGIGGESVRLDSQAKYGVLARGDAEVYLRMPTRADYRECIWDQAAGALVIEEAGGRVTDARGRALDFTTGRKLERNQGIVASNGVFHDRLIEAVARVAPPELT